jgi:DNA-binding XRE family transcriptional regulator
VSAQIADSATRAAGAPPLVPLAAVADVLESLPNLLRDGRERRNLTLDAVAEAVDVSAASLSMIEHRTRRPGFDLTVRLIRWLAAGQNAPLRCTACDKPLAVAAASGAVMAPTPALTCWACCKAEVG